MKACPICGGTIQSTRAEWMTDLVLSADGTEVVDAGEWSDTGETSVYCDNDHSQQDMVDHLRREEGDDR